LKNIITKKNHGEYCSNPQCFREKTTKLNCQPAQYEKNKIDKNNSEKKNKKKGNKTKIEEDNFEIKIYWES
jgi:hypothetical protein